MPNDQTCNSRGRQERWIDLPHLPERPMPGAHGSLALSAHPARADAAREGTLGRTRRKTNTGPYPRRDSQEIAGDSLAARLGDGGPRLLPPFGSRQPPPCLQAVRLGREEEQNLMGWSRRGLREAGFTVCTC